MAQAYPKHDEDFYAWTQSTADLLRHKNYNQVDFQHIIEELEALGASERRELRSRLAQLILHLLKYEYQTNLRSRSWQCSITEQRLALADLFQDNPSLKSQVEEQVVSAYKKALLLIEKETPLDLKALPATCPYTLEELQDDEYYPA